MASSARKSASATVTASDDAAHQVGRHPVLYRVLECRHPAAGGARWSLAGVEDVRIGRGTERRSERSEGDATLAIEVPDDRMSTRHARIAKLAGGWAFQDVGSKNGSRVNGVAASRAQLRDGDLVEVGETLFLFREEPGLGVTDTEAPIGHAPGVATLSPTIEAEYARLVAVAGADVPVLLLGETGTGKELAARAIHQLSQRKGQFVAVNCGALPSTLLEAELFGHRHGAFSGAVESRPGLIRSADKGTLFLDEIGDLALPSQAALLRALQEKEVLPVGETRPVKVDIRVVAATHHDVPKLCEQGAFRLDLLARLDGLTVRLPPLRERRADLGMLVAALLQRIAPTRARRIAFQARAGRALVTHDWPRNVRELEQALSAAVALATDDVITFEHLPERIQRGPSGPSSGPSSAEPASAPPRIAPESLSPEDTALRDQVVALLGEHQGSINAVARAMNKDRTQIRRWLQRFAIDADRFR